MKYESDILKRLINTYGVVGNPRYISEIIKEFIVQGKECFPNLFTYQADWLAHIDEFGLNPTYTVSYTGQSFYAPNTLEKPIKSAILKGSTKYRDIDTGDVLDTFDETKNLELVSVRMPVLTTFDGGIHLKSDFETGSLYASNGTNYDNVSNRIRTKRSYPTNGGTKIIFDPNITLQRIVFYYNNSTFVSNSGDWSKYNEFEIPNDVNNFRIIFQASNIESLPNNFHIMTNANKTNILTVNEDVELGSVCNVQDELNVLTGEVVKATTKIKLDSTLGWIVSNDYGDGKIGFISSKKIYGKNQIDGIVSDKFPTNGNGDSVSLSKGSGRLVITVLTSKISNWNDSDTNDEKVRKFGIYLDSLNAHARYINSEKVVKTVDLTIHDKYHQKVERLTTFKGGTHFTTSSQDGSLLPTLTVDVETDLEETLMVCSLEGNTI